MLLEMIVKQKLKFKKLIRKIDKNKKQKKASLKLKAEQWLKAKKN